MSYQNRYARNSAEGRKNKVRLRSKRISEALKNATGTSKVCGAERILDGPYFLNAEELEDVSRILGRKYHSISVVKHDFYDYEGWTAKIVTESLNYSEAFAGSGEFAVINLVRSLYQVKDGSLVLLDEPETSLHPGAQRQLCHFLLRMAKLKKLQIVMSTHSREIIIDLPNCARKVIGILPEDNHVALISDSASADEAFVRLGADFAKNTIYVEDKLAEEFVKWVLRKRNDSSLDVISVVPFPGGANTILNSLVPILAATDHCSMVILDGDQRMDFSEIHECASEKECKDELEKMGIRKCSSIPMNGGDDPDPLIKVRRYNETIVWMKNNIRFLPGTDPEGLALALKNGTAIEKRDNLSHQNKEKWKELARVEYGKGDGEVVNSGEILDLQKRVLATVEIDSSDAAKTLFKELSTYVDSLLDK